MKLKQILGSPIAKSKPAPTLSAGYYNGRLYFNDPSVKLLSLNENDLIAFFQDEDNPSDWYFKKVNSYGLKLKFAGKALVTFNSGIARGILRSVNLHDSSTFFISSEPVKIGNELFWKILTDNIIH
jgi:hypothetical protein